MTVSSALDSTHSYQPKATASQKLSLLLLALKLPFLVAVGVFQENKGRTWRRARNIAIARAALGRFTDISFLIVCPPTSEVYNKWARQQKSRPVTDVLPEGAKLHWLGRRRYDRVMLFFHGGGFTIPAGDHHFRFLPAVQDALKGSVGEIGIAFLEYSMAPQAQFPIQLRQANAALTHLLEHGAHPSNIVLCGDSAGGNLALQAISHILHPLPNLPPPPALSSPLGGAALISPWARFGTRPASYARNATRDSLPISFYDLLTDQITPGVTPELRSHVEPGTAPADWWTDLDKVLSRTILFAGEYEGLFDPIIELGDTLVAKQHDVKTVVEPGSPHDGMVEAFMGGDGGRGSDWRSLIAWLEETYQSST